MKRLRIVGVRFIAIKDSEKVRNYEKIIYSKIIFANGWWEDAYLPLILSLWP